jgi:arylsulfatase A-like enzyme
VKLLRQALATGLVGGAAWGAVEAVLVLLKTALPALLEWGVALPTSPADAASVLLLAAVDYALVATALTLLLAPLARFTCAWDETHLAAPRALVAGAVFVNLYWWTKPWWAFSWGLPFLHPARLAQSVLWLGLAAGVAWATVRDPRRPTPARGWVALGLVLLGVLCALLDLVAPHQAVGMLAPDKQGWFSGLWSRLSRVETTQALQSLLGWGGAGLLLAAATLRPGWWTPPRPRTVTALVLLLAVGGGWAFLRDRSLLAHAERPRPAEHAPNVLLVINDALRADHLGCYGHQRTPPVSPHADALAAQGVLFERAVTQAPFTWTSFGSFLTGKYPRRHGLMKMLPNQRLDPKANRTIAAALADAGYVTGAFMTGTLSNNSGLLSGFDTYFEALVGHDPVSRASKWSIVRGDLLLHRLKSKIQQALDVRLVNTEALRWMRANADRPFFAMVHYYATHTPYDPPAPYDRLYDPDYHGPFHPFTQSLGQIVLRARAEDPPREIFGPRDLQHVEALYDGGVAFADEMLGALLAELDQLGIADETLVIVTADHGEELDDHGVFEHDWMFNTNLRVPLILRLPGREHAGTRVPQPVELIDLPATVLAVTGHGSLGTLEDPEGRATSGRSLLPDCAGLAPPDAELWAFSENNRYLAMQDATRKLVVNRLDPRENPRVFDLAADPRELAPLQDAALRDELLARLEAWDRTMPALSSMPEFAADPTLLLRLNELGYTGANATREEDLARRAAHPAPGGSAPAKGSGQ